MENRVAEAQANQASVFPQQIHTPGPWAAGDPPHGRADHVYCNDPTGSAVARCMLDFVPRSRNEIEANARLIAAAPDMLAALELVRAFSIDRQSVLSDHYFEVVEVVRTAIAKATGASRDDDKR